MWAIRLGYEKDSARHNPKFSLAATILLPGERKAKRISAGGNHTLVLTTDDRVCVFGENPCGQLGLGDRKPRYKPVFLGLPKDCIPVKIFAGDLNSFIIDDKTANFCFWKACREI